LRSVFYIALFVLTACGSSSDNTVLAEVGNNQLTISDFISSGINFTDKKDSLEQLKSFVDQWIKQQTILNYALEQGEIDENAIDEKVNRYRNDLTIAEFERSYLSQHLDTTITDQQAMDFYTKNKSLFSLNDYVVKVFYAKIETANPKLKDISQNIKNADENSIAAIEEKYKEQFTASFYEKNEWILFNDLLRELEFDIEDKAKFLSTKTFIENETEEHVYLARIFSYQLKGEDAPLSLVKEKVKDLLLHQRSTELLNKLRNDIISKNYASAVNHVK
jgi:hypothetical protein